MGIGKEIMDALVLQEAPKGIAKEITVFFGGGREAQTMKANIVVDPKDKGGARESFDLGSDVTIQEAQRSLLDRVRQVAGITR